MAKILFIEDNLEIRENTSELLLLEGHDVLVAENGKEGISLATKDPPQIILCDIMMPGINGYEVFNTLKKNSSTQHIPFIFVTASAEKREMELALGMGADGYVRKPFDDQELYEVIKQCLQNGNR